MPYPHILFEVDDSGIALVTVNRPDKLNALSRRVMQDLDDVFDHVASRGNIRGAILTGAGEKAFVAGADISEIASLTAFEARHFAETGQQIFRKLELAKKPWVAAVNGF